MAASHNPAEQQRRLLGPATADFLLEDSDAEAGVVPAAARGGRPGGAALRRRVAAHACTLALGLAAVGAAAAWLRPSPPRDAGWQREGPLFAESLMADGGVVESKAEGGLADSSDPTAATIKWAKEPGRCVEVNALGYWPRGQGLHTSACGAGSAQFLLEAGGRGRIRWARHPEYCVTAPGYRDLELKNCSEASADISEFSFTDDGLIHVKSRSDDCLLVDTHSEDKQGRYSLVVQDCRAYDGDSPFPPELDDYRFTIEAPTTTTPAPTTTATATTVTATTTATTATATTATTTVTTTSATTATATSTTTTATTATATTTTATATTATATTTTTSTSTTTTSPHLPARVMLRSSHGEYIVAVPGGGIVCNGALADNYEQFEVVDQGEGQVALRSFHGYFVTADAVGTLTASATSPGRDERFHVEHLAGGKVAIKSAYGKYISAQPSGAVLADRTTFDDWEEFQVVDPAGKWPDHVAIKSFHGKYFRAYPHGALKADGVWPLDGWERFRVLRNADGTVVLRSDRGAYVATGAAGALHAGAGEARSAEPWEVAHLNDGSFTLRSRSSGKYVWAGEDGRVLADRAAPQDPWERLEVVQLP